MLMRKKKISHHLPDILDTINTATWAKEYELLTTNTINQNVSRRVPMWNVSRMDFNRYNTAPMVFNYAFFFSLFFFPLHLLYSIMPFFPPLFFSGLYWLTHHRASLGPNALTNFVSVFTEFTALKITGEEYAQRTRKIIPADHLFLVDKYISRLTCNIFVMLILSMLTDLLML